MFDFFKKLVSGGEKKATFDLDELEELLLESDIEYDVVEKILDSLPSSNITKIQLRNSLILLFDIAHKDFGNHEPFVDLVVGVNGAGKTTTIAKLAHLYKRDGKKVLLGAGDTFRAAAIDQLSIWASKIDVPIVKTQQGHDPSAVAFDAINSGVAKGMDNIIIDTAGRLQTQTNLSNELKKIVSVCDKAMSGAPHRKLLILDGTQGNAAINQLKAFDEIIGIDGVIITKLDGTAKGGAVFSIANYLRKPIFYIGTGEGMEDLVVFKPLEFIDSFLEKVYA